MPKIKQSLEILDIDSKAMVKFKVPEPRGEVSYYERIQDALLVARAIPGATAHVEILLTMTVLEQ